ncbi:hypothetical protein CXU13_01365 [Akkermansia muciniphila]|nr:hypothetical protein CXU12_12915 [Akkermansia muciniphila]PNC61283.1 hypothetical protein CXU13_01365 [Akkermansia muciniphila]
MSSLYKSRLPEETISLIKQELDVLGISLKERQTNHLSDFPSYRVETIGLDTFHIGTNGKGMNHDYARASAFAEYMERLQNGTLFNGQYGATKEQFETIAQQYPAFAQDIRKAGIAPQHNACVDEIPLNHEQLDKALDLMTLSGESRLAMEDFYRERKECLAIPFWKVFGEELVHLPMSGIYALLGSNGMCAGNTPHEAVLQGLCEIFERYAMRQLFESNLVMPDIPLSFFGESYIKQRIEELQKEHGVDIIVKDGSCGIGLPVIGVVVINKNSHQYLCKFGAAPVPKVALERCLTEMFQGSDKFLFHPIDVEAQAKLASDATARRREMYATYQKSMGHYPLSALVGKASYSFTGWPTLGNSHEQQLASVLDLLRKQGVNLYVRSVTYTKLYAYQCYIPGMSEAELDVRRLLRFMQARGELFHTLHHLGECPPDRMRKMAEILAAYPQYIYTLTSMNDKDVLCSGNVQLLLAILYYRTGLHHEATRALDKLIRNNPSPSELGLYHCLRDMIFAELGGIKRDTLHPLHHRSYIELVETLLTDEHWERFFNLPPCHNCKHCQLKEHCLANTFYTKRHQIEQHFSAHIPDQKQLQDIFSPLLRT